MRGNLFLVAAIVNPTKKEHEEDNALSKIVMRPKPIIARDDKDAAIKVIMDSEELKDVDRDKLEVVVRPF